MQYGVLKVMGEVDIRHRSWAKWCELLILRIMTAEALNNTGDHHINYRGASESLGGIVLFICPAVRCNPIVCLVIWQTWAEFTEANRKQVDLMNQSPNAHREEIS